MYVLHLLSLTSPEWSPLLGTTGAPAPSSSQDPVSLRSRSRYDSNTVSMLVSLMPLLQSPLQVIHNTSVCRALHALGRAAPILGAPQSLGWAAPRFY